MKWNTGKKVYIHHLSSNDIGVYRGHWNLVMVTRSESIFFWLQELWSCSTYSSFCEWLTDCCSNPSVISGTKLSRDICLEPIAWTSVVKNGPSSRASSLRIRLVYLPMYLIPVSINCIQLCGVHTQLRIVNMRSCFWAEIRMILYEYLIRKHVFERWLVWFYIKSGKKSLWPVFSFSVFWLWPKFLPA